VLRGQRSKHLLDYEELVYLRLSREEGLTISQLTHDTAEGPNVHVLAIVGGAQQQFRGPVPARGHVVCQWRIRTHGPRKAEIAEAQRIVRRIDQQVLRLDISVNDIMPMAVLYGSS